LKKGISRIPLEMARMKKEDIQESQSSSTVDDEFDFNA